MQHLIEDVLIYSKVARSEVSLSAVSLDKLVAAIIEDYPELQSPNAEIQVRRPLHAVCGNVALLTQAISNLLGNAVKFVQPSTLPKVNVWSETKNGPFVSGLRITALASIPNCTTGCSKCLNVCITPPNTKAPALAWRSSAKPWKKWAALWAPNQMAFTAVVSGLNSRQLLKLAHKTD